MSSSLSSSGLRIFQWNVCGIKNKLPEITKRCKEFDILLFSETFLQEQDICNLYGFDCIRKDRHGRRGGGVCIFVRKNIKYNTIPVIFDGGRKIEACAIQVFLDAEHLIFVSAYRPPNVLGINKQDWSRFFSQFHHKSIFCGDFNAHHLTWDDTKCCSEGYKINDAIYNSDYVFLNDFKFTYHSSAYNTWSAIDLSIVHASLGLAAD